MLQAPLAIDKEILGYKLKKRIGSGGFGEVWSAEAPGGLMKAVKVVFGYHDGKRAQTELKALDRVKKLRHPFLLSLERIEVYEGQLVVVSELADCSLADKFNSQISAGKSGVGREDMLRYARCSAEALDYLSSSHGLQHLDVKPENLLLVGDHVKVADFGLIKDLGQASQSLMSGMTPAYAAPELFDGRPGKFSDQYSLAIVYQEMLTGQRPFSGSTPAQLAAQHMNGRPDISALPSSDQPIVAKALAKDPACRFSSCREFAEELVNRRRTKKRAIRRRVAAREGDDTNALTHFEEVQTHDATALISGQSLPFQADKVKVLEPPICCASETKVRPVLVLGVGATGSKIVQKIKTQLVARHGTMAKLPSVKLMAIDSSLSSIDDLVRTSTSPLSAAEIISTPLKKPEDYRNQTRSHLGWLGRRWIYNIPRSLQTEGLRPLGRLAYADHFETLFGRLEKSVREITQAENLATTAETLEIDPGELSPRVFIVTSISGGIGSGMTLDLAYMTRLLLHECGLEPDSIAGVLLHSTYQRIQDPGLSAANAFAFLTELRHFHDHGYPGDNDNGVPEFDDVAPFDYTYFDDLGKDLCQSDFNKRIEDIAEYLLLTSTSKCASFFDKCRDFDRSAEDFSLRAFGISSTGPGKFAAGDSAAEGVSRKLLKYWVHGDATTDQKANELTQLIAAKYQTTMGELGQSIAALHNGLLSSQYASFKDDVCMYLNNTTASPSQLVDLFDRSMALPLSRLRSDSEESEFCVSLAKQVKELAMAAGEGVVSSLQESMEGKTLGLSLALAVCHKFGRNFKDARAQCDARSALLEEREAKQLQNLARLSTSRSKTKAQWSEQLELEFNEYVQTRTDLAVCRFATAFYRTAMASVESFEMMLNRQRRQLEAIGLEFQQTALPETPDCIRGDAFSLEALLNESIQGDIDQHVSTTEKLVYESLIAPLGGYNRAMNLNLLWQGSLKDEIVKQSHRVLADAYKKISLGKILAENNVQPEVFAKWLSDRMQEARPRVDDCGGGTRLLIGMPALSEDASLVTMVENHFGVEGCPVHGTEGSFVVCFESEGVGLANVAFRLLQARPDATDLVKRIHTRTDVQWTSLDDLL